MSDTIVEIREIGMTYEGGCEALRGLTLDIPRSELTSLIGPSGCGKTTLLKIMAGLIRPTKGEIVVEGKRVEGPGPKRALVFQDFALLPWATTLRNVAFGLELRRVPRRQREKTAKAYIDQVGLSGFEKSYPHELSGGMQQRVGLARALAVDAAILLMDEPFASVDEQTRRQFQEDLISLLRGEQKTVVFVTHSIEEAVYVSDRIVLLSPRPGNVMQILDTELARDQDAEAIRRSKAYLDYVDQLWNVLKNYLQ